MLQDFKEKSFADRGGNRMKADEVIAEVVKLCKSFGANEVIFDLVCRMNTQGTQ